MNPGALAPLSGFFFNLQAKYWSASANNKFTVEVHETYQSQVLVFNLMYLFFSYFHLQKPFHIQFDVVLQDSTLHYAFLETYTSC